MHLTALINNSWISVLKCPLSVQLWFNNLQGSPDAELKLLSDVAATLPMLCNRSSVKSQSKILSCAYSHSEEVPPQVCSSNDFQEMEFNNRAAMTG